jgi:hypothetical protein
MKRELTLPDIVGYLPYGLYCWYGENIKAALMAGITDYQIPIFEVGRKPILRPMSDLYVEITERGYNDGKPFIPIVELANLLGSPEVYQWELHSDGRCAFSSKAMEYFRWLEVEKSFLHSLSYRHDYSGYDICNQHEMYDLLHRLHFDYRGLIDAGLAVSVHDLPTNPYEA